MFISRPDLAPFAFAGLWESWHNKAFPDRVYRSCTIITREAAGAVRELHHRMPVILDPEVYSTWLDPGCQDPQSLSAILRDHAITDLVFHPVDKAVNSVRKNDPSNIKPIQTEFEFE